MAINPAVRVLERIYRLAEQHHYLSVDECLVFLEAFDRQRVEGFRNDTVARFAVE